MKIEIFTDNPRPIGGIMGGSPKVLHALAIAEAAHAGQLYGDEPYIEHCKRVANLMAQRGGTEEDVIVALLHDTLEDTELLARTIFVEFGWDVAQAVMWLTRNKNEPYRQYIERIATDAQLRQIKLCDIQDHIEHCRINEDNENLSLLKRYVQAEVYLETP